MEVRQIRPEDADDFVVFYKKLTEESGNMMFTADEVDEKADEQKKFIKELDDYKQIFIALDDNEKIVGYLGISRSHLQKLMHRAKFTIGVLEEYQNKGVGTNLLELAEEWANDHDVKRLELNVIEDNDPAIEFFEKNEFEKEGYLQASIKFGDDYVDEIVMAKML